MVRSSKTWKVEQQCPQCGAPVLLEETDRLFSCSYCRVRLYLSSGDFFRYYLPPADPSVKEVIFVPYWRFKGMSFSCKASKTEERLIDTTAMAADYNQLPPSLGVRPQAIPMRFVSSELKAHFFLPHRQFKTVFSWIENKILAAESLSVTNHDIRSISSSEFVFHRAFIGETVSLIYLPLFIRGNAFYDAITGDPVAPFPKKEEGAFTFHTFRDWQVRFIPTLCPLCGWDLHGEKDSLVLLCKNCDSAWEASENGYRKIDFAVIPGEKGSSIFLPFWRIKARVTGVSLRSYADLVRFTNLPKVIRGEWEEQDIYFWAPAFKVRPKVFLNTARLATIAQVGAGAGQTLPNASMYPVTIPASEAVQSLKITLVNMAVPRRNILALIKEVTIEPLESLLVFIPFSSSTHEYIQEQMHLSLNRSAMKYGRNL